MNKLTQNPIIKYVIAFAIGIGIGAVFYPSKTIEREIESKYQSKIERLGEEKKYIESKYSEELNKEIKSNIEYRKDTEQKISSLHIENTQLKQKVKERSIKIIKPDGTITEETFKETDTEVVSRVVSEIKSEFNEKVASIESKWETIHRNRVTEIKSMYEKQLKEKEETISEYKMKEKITINKRAFGISIGIKNDEEYFSSIQYDIYGPFFLDLHFEANKELNDNGAGIGFGMRF